MLGKQSTAEFAGLHMDVLKVGELNSRLEGPGITRKSGMIINTGGNTLLGFFQCLAVAKPSPPPKPVIVPQTN